MFFCSSQHKICSYRYFDPPYVFLTIYNLFLQGFCSYTYVFNNIKFVLAAVVSSSCPSNWMEFGQNCFQIESSTYKWHDAVTRCRKADPLSHLATISSQSELDWLWQRVGNDKSYWIGLYRSKIGKQTA